MKNGKRRNSSHFKQAIPNFAFASPFYILHSSFLSFVSWCLGGPIPTPPERTLGVCDVLTLRESARAEARGSLSFAWS